MDTQNINTIEMRPGEPLELTWFNTNNDVGLTFVAPVFGVIGFTVCMLALDLMHICDLGTSQHLIGTVFWQLIIGNFAKSDARTVLVRNHENLLHLRRMMKAFYIQERIFHQKGRCAIHKLTLKMLGDYTDLGKMKLHAKAAETRHLVPLLPLVCAENPSLFQEGSAVMLPFACRAFADFQKLYMSNPRYLAPDVQATLETLMLNFLNYYKASGAHMVFKFHMCYHIIKQSRTAGNPRFMWT